MDALIFEDVANSLSKLKMYPYFDICNYILMSIAVKEDTPQSGAGYCEMKLLQRLARGVWLPASNEFIHPTFTTKISLAAAIAYYCHHLDLVPFQENELFLVIAGILVYLRVTMILLGLKDPFVPFENIICTVLFGGTVDALRNAFELSRSKIAEAPPPATSPVPGMPGSIPTTTATSATATTANMNASTGPPSSPTHSPSGTFMGGPGQTSVRDNFTRPPATPADKKRD